MAYEGWDEPSFEPPDDGAEDRGYEKQRQARIDGSTSLKALPDSFSDEGAMKCCNQLMSHLQQSMQSVFG